MMNINKKNIFFLIIMHKQIYNEDILKLYRMIYNSKKNLFKIRADSNQTNK